jgi:hypothetical protein
VLRDNLAGLIEPMLDSAGAFLKLALALLARREYRTIDPLCLENPRPEGAESFASSHYEPRIPNDFGVAVGPYEDTSAKFVAHTAIRFPDGTITTFEVPGSSMEAGQGTLPARFSGLNNFGVITGLWYDANNNLHGYLRTRDGNFTDFEAPGADTMDESYGTSPDSINDFGAITGYYLDASGVYHGFLRSPDGNFTTPLDAPGADLTPGDFNGTFPSNINLLGAIVGAILTQTMCITASCAVRSALSPPLMSRVLEAVLSKAPFPSLITFLARSRDITLIRTMWLMGLSRSHVLSGAGTTTRTQRLQLL